MSGAGPWDPGTAKPPQVFHSYVIGSYVPAGTVVHPMVDHAELETLRAALKAERDEVEFLRSIINGMSELLREDRKRRK